MPIPHVRCILACVPCPFKTAQARMPVPRSTINSLEEAPMMNTRRDLFRMAAVPVAWHAFHAKLKAAAASRLPDAGNESYWQMVKRQYPLADNLIYLNAANVCPWGFRELQV